MTKCFVTAITLVLCFSLTAQEKEKKSNFWTRPADEFNYVEDTTDRSDRLKVWEIYEDNAERHFVPMDTSMLNFYNFNPIYKKSIANNYLGNLGSPYESMIYFDRPRDLQFGLSDVYRAYMFMPEDFKFYNTKTPYTRVQYTSAAPKRYREESLQVLFSRNVNKDWNVTAFGNLYFGRGLYAYQGTKQTNFTFLTSYLKPRYQAYFIINENSLRNKENGGIVNDDNILHPEDYTDIRNPIDINTNFTDGVESKLYNTNVFLKHKYNIGYEKPIVKEDTTLYDFIPVTSVVHTFKLNNNIKYYNETASQSAADYEYPDTFIMTPLARDRYSERNITNEFGLYLNEGVNKYSIFGLGAYISNTLTKVENNPWRYFNATLDTAGYSEAYNYYSGKTPSIYMDSATYDFAQNYSPDTYSNTKVGGTLYKRLGKSFFFNLKGELYLQGFRAGDYLLYGDVMLRFNKLDSAYFKGTAELSGRTPYYYMHQYYSNNYWWDKDLEKINNQRFTGEISLPKIHTIAKFSIENIFEYVYFDSEATNGILQQAPNVQVLSVDFKKDFTFGNWHWDNNLIYQASTSSAIPVPDLSVYTNFYFHYMIFKVLDMQLGFDAYYHTSYNAPVYIPSLGRFANQTETEIGNYPLMNVYGNFHLKRMRFFVKYYHVNEGLFLHNSFASPSYPYNPRMLSLGLSWNFYD